MLRTTSENAKSSSPTTAVSRRLLLTGLAFLLLIGAAVAASGARAADMKDPEVVGALNRIAAYMTDLDTLKSRFIQANPDGSYVEGSMYMDRPGRMRFEYDEPVPILLVANGSFLIHVDKDLEQVSHIPLSSTPANFLLQENVSFEAEGVRVTDFSREAGLLRVEVIQADEPDAGSVQITFTENPLQLKQWTVTDPQQLRTTVTLLDPTTGMKLDPELFRFFNPWDGRDK